jgi:MFS family permease
MTQQVHATKQSAVLVDSPLAWRVLLLVTVTYAVAYIDRHMLNLLVDPIKRSLLISDTQFGLLQGPAFVAAYLVASPVWGRLIDLGNRRDILVFCVCAWSAFTVLCGTAHSYTELVIYRLGVGFMEASVLPIAWSWMGDYFSRARVPRAMSVFVCSSQLGGGIALIASGSVMAAAVGLREAFPIFESLATWQMAFVVIGAPGLLLAGLLILAIREPARQRAFRGDAAERRPPLREVLAFFWSRRGFYLRTYPAIGLVLIVQLGVPAWYPAFLIRAHGMSAATVGRQFGLLTIFVGSSGLLVGPLVAEWFVKRNYVNTPLTVAAFSTFGMMASCAAIPFVPGDVGSLAIGAIAIFFACLPVAVIDAANQMVTPSRMRGISGSLHMFSAQIISNGIGVPLIALITDRVFHDPTKVGYSLQFTTVGAAALAALLLFTVRRTHRQILGERGEQEINQCERKLGAASVEGGSSSGRAPHPGPLPDIQNASAAVAGALGICPTGRIGQLNDDVDNDL